LAFSLVNQRFCVFPQNRVTKGDKTGSWRIAKQGHILSRIEILAGDIRHEVICN